MDQSHLASCCYWQSTWHLVNRGGMEEPLLEWISDGISSWDCINATFGYIFDRNRDSAAWPRPSVVLSFPCVAVRLALWCLAQVLKSVFVYEPHCLAFHSYKQILLQQRKFDRSWHCFHQSIIVLNSYGNSLSNVSFGVKSHLKPNF